MYLLYATSRHLFGCLSDRVGSLCHRDVGPELHHHFGYMLSQHNHLQKAPSF